jgi:hypothetical protein
MISINVNWFIDGFLLAAIYFFGSMFFLAFFFYIMDCLFKE